MGASASVERSPLVLRANLLMRYHAGCNHHRTLAQAVYSKLYQTAEWSMWVSSDAMFRVLLECLKCADDAATLDHTPYLRTLQLCEPGAAAIARGTHVYVHGEDMISFLASGRLPIRTSGIDHNNKNKGNNNSSDVNDSDVLPQGPVAVVAVSTSTRKDGAARQMGGNVGQRVLGPDERAGVVDEATSAAGQREHSTAKQEQLLSSFLTIDHLVLLQEWILTPDRSGRSPMDYAKQVNDTTLLQRMQATLVGGVQVQADDLQSATQPLQQEQAPQHLLFPLHVAAKAGELEKVKSLLDAGMDPMAKDERDNLPIYYACLCGHLDCCAFLAEVAGGVHAMDPAQRLRCSTNALNQHIRLFLKTGVMPSLPASSEPANDKDQTTHDGTAADWSLFFS